MSVVKEHKEPLVIAWVGRDTPLRGDSQMAIGLAKLCAEMTGGRYVYVDELMLKENFPKAKDYAEMESLAAKKFGTPDILIGNSEAAIACSAYFKGGPQIECTHIGETISRRYCQHGMVPHNVNDKVLAEEKQKFQAHYPQIKGPLVAVMVASYQCMQTDMIRDLQRIAENYDDITFVFCPNRRAKTDARDLASQMRYDLKTVFSDNTLKGYVRHLMKSTKARIIDVDYKQIENGYNPYLGLLASADHIIVSGHSYSMVSDALYMGKTVYIDWHREDYDKLIEDKHIVMAYELKKHQTFPTVSKPRLDATRDVASYIASQYTAGRKVVL